MKLVAFLTIIYRAELNKELSLGNKDFKKEPKDGEVKKLKAHIRHQDKEIARLKSELRSLEAAFSKNITFLKSKTNQLDLHTLIEAANEEINLAQIEDKEENKIDNHRKRWICYSCETNVLKIVIIPKGEDRYYFRKCSNPKCSKRTEAKLLTENVDMGI